LVEPAPAVPFWATGRQAGSLSGARRAEARAEIRSRPISAAIEKAIATILLWMVSSSCQI